MWRCVPHALPTLTPLSARLVMSVCRPLCDVVPFIQNCAGAGVLITRDKVRGRIQRLHNLYESVSP